MPYDESIALRVQRQSAWNKVVEIENDIQIKSANGENVDVQYTPRYNLKSLYGSGGYVFLFDREQKKDRFTGLKL